MVSPKRTTDVENLRTYGPLSSGIHAIKNQTSLKPTSLPLGDVSNIVKSSRQLQQKLTEASKSNKEQEFSKCGPKSACAPAADQVQQVVDPIWDAPLAFGGEIEDTYWDIIPLSLQLTSEDLSRLVFNKPRTHPSKQTEHSFEFDLPLPPLPDWSIDINERLHYPADSDDELPPVDCVTLSDDDSSFWSDSDDEYEVPASVPSQR